MHPCVSFPVTIDGFLCLPAHKGTQGIKRTDRGVVCPGCLSVCPTVFVCVRRQMCTCVDAEAWHLSGWGAYENISPGAGTNLYLSNVSSGDWQSNTQGAPPSFLPSLPPSPELKVMVLLGCCYILGWCSWAGYILSEHVAFWLYIGLDNIKGLSKTYLLSEVEKGYFLHYNSRFFVWKINISQTMRPDK